MYNKEDLKSEIDVKISRVYPVTMFQVKEKFEEDVDNKNTDFNQATDNTIKYYAIKVAEREFTSELLFLEEDSFSYEI
jgi:hypothetical protein